MKVYAGMDPRLPLDATAAHARRVERLGYDGLQVPETVHDAMAVATLIAEHTERITVRTSVALAFVRSPVLLAYSAWDLAKFSGGRFELGLGTQIRQNIEERYGVAFGDHPVARLRDYLGAVRAAFQAFRSGEPPRYDSPAYRVTRMQPYFNPGPDDSTDPPLIYLGGVQRPTCELAGELADGFITHPTNANPRYLQERCLPALADGARATGRDLRADRFEVVIGTPIVTGGSQAAVDAERERQRRLLAFLYSTPSYRPTLELYGWDDLGPKLRDLIRRERWDDLGSVLSDDVMDTLVPCARFSELARVLAERFAGLGQGIVVSPPPHLDDDNAFAEVIAELRQAGETSSRPA